MHKHLYHKLLFLLIATTIYSCGTEEELEKIQVTENAFSKSTDSLFGNLSEEQLYWQHLILDIPATMQSNLDSLQNFILVNQPGGLNLVNWNIDSIEDFSKK